MIERGKHYLDAGADGIYVEGATSILEGGGKTPWLSPRSMHEFGFSMILYPTSVLFRAVRAIQEALDDLKAMRWIRSEASAWRTSRTSSACRIEPEERTASWGQSEQGDGIVGGIRQS